MITTAADIKLLRDKVSNQIETLEPTLEISDDNHTVAREIIAEIPTVLEDITNGIIPNAEHIARVAITACKDIQFRDFLLGAYTEYDKTAVSTWLEFIGGAVKKDYAYPIATVLSAYYYRDNNKDEAMDIIMEVLNHKPDYSLAQLLNRIYPIYTVEQMQELGFKLHSSVKATIFQGGENN